MPRSKLNLVYIANDSSRRVTFTKRMDGLAKKADELTNLCGIEACIILFSPYDHEPEVWPSQLEAQKVIARFRKMSDLEQSELMLNQESFTQERINKINEKMKKQEKVNQQQEMS
ncbi:hypothetical protein Vadar_014917 [Vaccinium darrowii]|uniref:Uncharacterized protein n=1 Tax=Vaccinium darrowii TaxID=229202 RepID=A0ACB7ZBK9_9ERIC|nr:hypothetical protein Vadar_014917 [Vaccinium darrowii]